MTDFSELAANGITVRSYQGKRPESPEAITALSLESQAGLRQFSLERMTGYGIDYADAVELRARILGGEDWRLSATALAEEAIAAAERPAPRALVPTQIACHLRASALLRMSQALMLEDDHERHAIVVRASDHFARAAELGGNRRRVVIETDGGPLAGWLAPAQGEARGSAIIIGGVEGWAMDFDSTGEALARRGVNALTLDGPGQGESRIVHRHYLTPRWLGAFRKAIDFLSGESPVAPIGIVGNSMGGGIALAVANNDPRIAACCNNGGIIKPILARQAGGTFFAKMLAFCGQVDEATAVAAWETILPVAPGSNRSYAHLSIQGGRDPMVPIEHGQMVFDHVPVTDKHMELFSDGDHCIYNHRLDRDILIADWMAAKLGAARRD